ncbi:MAG: hypothetical protein GXY52_03190, partial [Chloroflexi bacterium]|nr:hypothetical protein [Chloroflexota bacterium]
MQHIRAQFPCVVDDEVWQFLRIFNIQFLDVDQEYNTTLDTLALRLRTTIPYVSPGAIIDWCFARVSHWNPNEATITAEELRKQFLDTFGVAEISSEVPSIPQDLTATLRVAVLAGGWDESSQLDIQVIRALAGTTYESWKENLGQLIEILPTSIKLEYGKLRVINRRVLLQHISSSVYDHHFLDLERVMLTVLGEPNAFAGYSFEEYLIARLEGKANGHSRALRTGLAETLVFIRYYYEAFTNCNGDIVSFFPGNVVECLLKSNDWAQWVSLNDVMPLLAEAAPSQFLSAVERMLSEQPTQAQLQKVEEASTSCTSDMTGLLWSLETLAWESQHFLHAINLLAKLDSRDSAEHKENRAVDSLARILLPWCLQTKATLDNCSSAVEQVIETYPQTGWKLLLSLLGSKSVTYPINRPLWSDEPQQYELRPTPDQERIKLVDKYATLAIKVVKTDPNRLVELTSCLFRLPSWAIQELLDYLEKFEFVAPKDDALQEAIWRNLLDQSFLLKNDRLPGPISSQEYSDRLDSLITVLTPRSPTYRYRILFENTVHNQPRVEGTYKERQERLWRERVQAITEIYQLGGIDEVLEFSHSVGLSGVVGSAFADAVDAISDNQIFPTIFGSLDSSIRQFLRSFVSNRFLSLGWKWVDGIDVNNWPVKWIAQLLMNLPCTPATWDRVDKLLVGNDALYWQAVDLQWLPEPEHLEFAVRKLLEHKRALVAVRCLHEMCLLKTPINPVLLVKVLKDVATIDNDEIKIEIKELVISLQTDPNADRDEVCNIEWLFLDDLVGLDNKCGAICLMRKLA